MKKALNLKIDDASALAYAKRARSIEKLKYPLDIHVRKPWIGTYAYMTKQEFEDYFKE